jgi:hypothetical protein
MTCVQLFGDNGDKALGFGGSETHTVVVVYVVRDGGGQ